MEKLILLCCIVLVKIKLLFALMGKIYGSRKAPSRYNLISLITVDKEIQIHFFLCYLIKSRVFVHFATQ